MQDLSCPFREGRRYLVRLDYSFLNHCLRAGEVVVFRTHGYSAKEGVMRYWFRKADSDEMNAWHIFGNQKQTIQWYEMFDELAAA
jgi:hypothetical protein